MADVYDEIGRVVVTAERGVYDDASTTTPTRFPGQTTGRATTPHEQTMGANQGTFNDGAE